MQAKNDVKKTFLKDYQQPEYLIRKIDLNFDLYENRVVVHSKLAVVRNPASASHSGRVLLHGEKLKLLSVKLNGKVLEASEYTLSEKSLELSCPEEAATVEIETEIYPQENKTLEGLYKSDEIFCTQNEPEGFRKITYFIDRPDVMAVYTTRITAEKKRYPVLLANGNPVDQGDLPEGRHFAVWEDPFPKPSYLFALVVGDLGCVRDEFVTRSGRSIDLRIYVDKGNEKRCSHAMTSLKNAMKWDEDVFGLECDLDIYMIVAVDAFNMGAMENKGLNIFNSQYVLADPETATDQNYQGIEGVIAHEYFHNWTGNRVTCRDWFQLTLKEGLTVFRDQEFSADMTCRPVKRIADVRVLRDFQFAEDAGPNAHPIRPAYYLEINNFYTSTVYNKGAEVIRMAETLIGRENFRKGITKYFELYDGQAVTTEDFLHAMALVSGYDFTLFQRWYEQAGTPVCRVSGEYDSRAKTYRLTVSQEVPATSYKQDAKPFTFPLVTVLLDDQGREIPAECPAALKQKNAEAVLEIRERQQVFEFKNVPVKPVPSLLRNFSAPVRLDYVYTDEDLRFLMSHETDAFNRFEAAQVFMTRTLLQMADQLSKNQPCAIPEGFMDAAGAVIRDAAKDPAFYAEVLTLPSVTSLVSAMPVMDFDHAFEAKEIMVRSLADAYMMELMELYEGHQTEGPYQTDAYAVGRRSLKNTMLHYLSYTQSPESIALMREQFMRAENMTDEMAALSCLVHWDIPEAGDALHAFYEKWKKEPLVMNKWFAVQAMSKLPGTLSRVRELEKDPVFDMRNPNKVRSLIGAFSQNLIRFHDASGEGYAYIAGKIMEIDRFNPSIAARLSAAFKFYARLDTVRQARMKTELERILAQDGLSKDVYEIISNTLQNA